MGKQISHGGRPKAGQAFCLALQETAQHPFEGIEAVKVCDWSGMAEKDPQASCLWQSVFFLPDFENLGLTKG